MSGKYRGFIAVIVSAIVFGLMPFFAKIIYANGGNPVSLVFYRFFIAIPVLFISIKLNKNISLGISKEEFLKIIVVAVIGYSGTAMLLFLSYNYISTGMTTTIHFGYPMFVILGCAIFYKEKVNYVKAISVLLSTFGIMFFFDRDAGTSITGISIAFLSGITYAFYIIYIDKSGLKKMHSLKLTFYLCVIAAPIIFAFSLITGNFTISITPFGWLLTSILSVGVTLGAVSLFQVGIKMVGPQSAAILSTFEPITSVIMGILVLNEVFSLRVFMGCVLVLLSVIILAAFEKTERLAGNEKEISLKEQ